MSDRLIGSLPAAPFAAVEEAAMVTITTAEALGRLLRRAPDDE